MTSELDQKKAAVCESLVSTYHLLKSLYEDLEESELKEFTYNASIDTHKLIHAIIEEYQKDMEKPKKPTLRLVKC